MEKHAQPPTGFGGGLVRLNVIFGGSGGIMATARPDCLTHVVPRPRLGTSLLRGGSSVTVWQAVRTISRET